jgi:PleD family two-component response regulator
MKRVLVIDDHVPSRDNLKCALAASGCQVAEKEPAARERPS